MRRRCAVLALVVALGAGPSAAAQDARPSSFGEGVVAAAIDPQARICRNFYRHACGGFVAATPVDARTPSVSLADRRFETNLSETLNAIFQPQPGVRTTRDGRRLAAFDKACRASAGGDDAADLALVQAWLHRIDAIDRRAALAPTIRELAAIGVDAFVTFGGRSDPGDIARYRGEVHSARFLDDPAIIASALSISGQAPDAAGRAAADIARMTAKLAPTAVGRYDFAANQHPMTQRDLAALSPAFDWPAYLAATGLDPAATVNVTSPAYVRAVEAALTSEELATLKAYLRWSFLYSLRGEAPRRYDAAFAGLPPPLRPSLETAQRCRDAAVRALGIEFSRELSRRAPGPKGRDEALKVAQAIRAAFVSTLADTPFLTQGGRRATAAKLAATDLKIGYPDRWPATGDFPVRSDAFLSDVLAARRFEQAREWRRAGEGRSRFDWEFKVSPWVGEGMAAARLAVPNGYPDAFTNSMTMTAAFLAPPRFDARAPLEVNLATFGSILGHEFVHVAQSHEFDSQGRLADIWGAADIAGYEQAGQCVIEEARSYAEAEGLTLDPRRQYDENAADLGGVRVAFAALKDKLGVRLNRPDAAGVSPAMRFFYAYAQNYCTAETEAFRRQGAQIDGHGPAEFRVNAVLANTPGFAEAFGCEAGTPMTRPAAKICQVW